MSVGQANREVLERFRLAVGKVGTIYGPYKPKSRDGYRRKPMFKWQASRRVDVEHAIGTIWPWLSDPKREQAIASLRG